MNDDKYKPSKEFMELVTRELRDESEWGKLVTRERRDGKKKID